MSRLMAAWKAAYADLPRERLIELLEHARATNTRLHRRCQHAEHEAVYFARRYDAVQRPLEAAQARVEGYARQLKALYQQEYRLRWRYCWGCRALWWVKQWVRRW